MHKFTLPETLVQFYFWYSAVARGGAGGPGPPNNYGEKKVLIDEFSIYMREENYENVMFDNHSASTNHGKGHGKPSNFKSSKEY